MLTRPSATFAHPVIVSVLDEHKVGLIQSWLDELRSLSDADDSEGDGLVRLGSLLTRLHGGADLHRLEAWASANDHERPSESLWVPAALRFQRLLGGELAQLPQPSPEAADTLSRNGEIIVRALVDAQLQALHSRFARRDEDRPAGRFTELADVLMDTLYSAQPDGQVLYMSDGIQSLTGLPAERFLHDPGLWERQILPEDRQALPNLIDKVLRERRVTEAVYRIRHAKTLGVRHILHRATPVMVGEQVSRVDGILLDMTERRELEARLERSVHLRSLGQLAGGIAHDFNNLLVSILGYADLLLVRADPGSKEATALDLIMAAAERGAELTERLLTFARGSTSRNKVATRLEHVLRDTLALVTPSVPRAIRLGFHEDPDVPVVIADAPQIGEAILNLVLNAVQACENDRGDEVAVIIRGSRPDEAALINAEGGCTIVVEDNGPGMTTEVLSHVFEPLFTTRGEEGGSGLGCAMAYGVAVDHGGILVVDSEEGTGATFRFILPSAPPDVRPVRRGRKVMPTPVARVRGAHHVLVADDEPSVGRLIGDVLENAGYRVTSVLNGRDAIDAVVSQPDGFDLIILDVMMEPVDGTEAFTRIREISPDTPALFCTGFSDASRVRMPEALTAAPVIRKPFRPVDLVEHVRTRLRHRKRG